MSPVSPVSLFAIERAALVHQPQLDDACRWRMFRGRAVCMTGPDPHAHRAPPPPSLLDDIGPKGATGAAAWAAQRAYAQAGDPDDAAYWNAWRPGPDERAIIAAIEADEAIKTGLDVAGGPATDTLYSTTVDGLAVWTPERVAIQEQAIMKATVKITDNGKTFEVPAFNPAAAVGPNGRPFVAFVIGPAGSGKSSAIMPLVAHDFDLSRTSVVNNDDLKAELPEYGKGEGAARVQGESSYMAEARLIPMLQAARHNVVIDGVGKTAPKMIQSAKEFHALGYDVYVYHVEVPPARSLLSTTGRAFESGRLVPPQVVLTHGFLPSGTYATLKHSGLLKGGVSLDNDVPKGTQPKVRDEFGERPGGPSRQLGERHRQWRDERPAAPGPAHPVSRAWPGDPDSRRGRPDPAHAGRGPLRPGVGGAPGGGPWTWQAALADWDESQHPRDPKGTATGGQWTDKPGAVASVAPKGGGAGFGSSNVEEATDDTARPQTFAHAYKRLDSGEQARFRSIGRDIDKATGLSSTITDAVGDWADGAENSTVSVYSGDVSYDQLKYAMAWKGLLFQQKSVIPFLYDDDGPDALYTIDINQPAGALRASLSKHGIQYRTLEPLGNGKKTRVHVFSPGSDDNADTIPAAVDAFATEHKATQVTFDLGRGEVLGSWTSRAEGLKVYKAIIRAYESQDPVRPRYRPKGGYRLHEHAPGDGAQLYEALKARREDARVSRALDALAANTATALTVAAEAGARVDRILAQLDERSAKTDQQLAERHEALTREVTAAFDTTAALLAKSLAEVKPAPAPVPPPPPRPAEIVKTITQRDADGRILEWRERPAETAAP